MKILNRIWKTIIFIFHYVKLQIKVSLARRSLRPDDVTLHKMLDDILDSYLEQKAERFEELTKEFMRRQDLGNNHG